MMIVIAKLTNKYYLILKKNRMRMQSQITAALFDEKVESAKTRRVQRRGGYKGKEVAKREIDFKLEIGKTRN